MCIGPLGPSISAASALDPAVPFHLEEYKLFQRSGLTDIRQLARVNRDGHYTTVELFHFFMNSIHSCVSKLLDSSFHERLVRLAQNKYFNETLR